MLLRGETGFEVRSEYVARALVMRAWWDASKASALVATREDPEQRPERDEKQLNWKTKKGMKKEYRSGSSTSLTFFRMSKQTALRAQDQLNGNFYNQFSFLVVTHVS